MFYKCLGSLTKLISLTKLSNCRAPFKQASLNGITPDYM